MRARSALTSILSIRAGEGQVVTLLLLHSLCAGIAQVFFATAASTLFLIYYGADTLPTLCILSSFAAVIVGRGYTWLGIRLFFGRLLVVTLTVLLVVAVVLRLFLGLEGARWPIFVLQLWVGVQSVLYNLEFWSLAGRLLTVRQGKRLYGLVGSGQSFAAAVGGLLIPVLVGWLGTPNLLLITIAGTVGGLVTLLALTRRFGDMLAEPEHKDDPGISMYLIVGGRVRVHDGDRTLNELGDRDVFGEMAALDAVPRSASVTTIEETRLLRLDQDALYGIMSGRIEVVRVIIRMLSNRLRDRVEDVVHPQGKLDEQRGPRGLEAPLSHQGYHTSRQTHTATYKIGLQLSIV